MHKCPAPFAVTFGIAAVLLGGLLASDTAGKKQRPTALDGVESMEKGKTAMLKCPAPFVVTLAISTDAGIKRILLTMMVVHRNGW